MPTIQQTTDIKITPERFLNACNDLELFELDNLLQRPVYQTRIAGMFGDIKAEHIEVKPVAIGEARYLCKECRENPVDADNGQEICTECSTQTAPTLQS
jgi:hypothetical protein